MSGIEDHNWNDALVEFVDTSDGVNVFIGFDRRIDETIFSKGDIVAIAKALGVTGEDLK